MANTKTNAIDQVRFSSKEREYAFSIAMKYVKDSDEASDVAQDALLNAYRHRHTFRGTSKYLTWLYRVVATTALMHLRKRRRQTRDHVFSTIDDLCQAETAGFPVPRAAGPSPEEQCLAVEAVAAANNRLAKLDRKYRDIFTLRFCDGYSEFEIASKLAMKVATVKTRAYRARAAIRDHLQVVGV